MNADHSMLKKWYWSTEKPLSIDDSGMTITAGNHAALAFARR
ncbi:MAG: hypothetical protein ABSB19_12585 [Methylomonas sp.]|jgi:hypothetical protein